MPKVSPTPMTEKTLTTSNPYLKGEPTRWPTLEQYQEEEIEVFPECLMAVYVTKPVKENDENN